MILFLIADKIYCVPVFSVHDIVYFKIGVLNVFTYIMCSANIAKFSGYSAAKIQIESECYNCILCCSKIAWYSTE